MTSTSVTAHDRKSLVLSPEQDEFTERQVAVLRALGVEGATNGDMAVFHHVCQRTGLDPFARQIYMLSRRTKDRDGNWVAKQTIQTGIDGYRLIARRAVDKTHERFGIGEALWCGDDGRWTDVWLSNRPPAAAKVTVTRAGEPFTAVALWREYVQTARNGETTVMWATRSAGQLAKCAEALALRKAFPQDLAGVYVEEETARDDVAYTAAAEPASAADRIRAMLGTEVVDLGDAPEAPQTAVMEPVTKPQLAKLHVLLGEVGVGDRDDCLAWLSAETGRTVASSKDLTRDEASGCITALDRLARLAAMPVPEAPGEA